MRPSRSTAMRAGASLLASLALVAGLGSCSGGGEDPTSPDQQTSETYYVRAHFELLDANPPCTVLPCSPEFISCEERQGVYAGATWDMHADVVGVGWLTSQASRAMSPGSVSALALSASDTVRRTGLTFQLTINPTTLGASYGPSDSDFVDVDLNCGQLNPNNAPESRFTLQAGAGNTVTVTQAQTTGTVPYFVGAVQQGAVFSPEGVVAGRFDFLAQALQELPTGLVSPVVRVTGCFLVPVPDFERGVPVNPEPSGASCP
jgi:hypothetical protein